ncbi:MAG: hypothetical protein Q4D43_10765, partial [Clostridia bacterium]|nr:hypothetical protein [Clostridia bacterium]
MLPVPGSMYNFISQNAPFSAVSVKKQAIYYLQRRRRDQLAAFDFSRKAFRKDIDRRMHSKCRKYIPAAQRDQRKNHT